MQVNVQAHLSFSYLKKQKSFHARTENEMNKIKTAYNNVYSA